MAASVSASGSRRPCSRRGRWRPSTTYTATLLGGAAGSRIWPGTRWPRLFVVVHDGDRRCDGAELRAQLPGGFRRLNASHWTAGCSPPGCAAARRMSARASRRSRSRSGALDEQVLDGHGLYEHDGTVARRDRDDGVELRAGELELPGCRSYSVRVRATDTSGNIETPATTTFVYDNANPTSTMTFPVATASYTTTTWNKGCAAPGMCGTATDAVAGVQTVEISIRRGSGNYWHGTAFSKCVRGVLSAMGTTAWSFSSPLRSSRPVRTTRSGCARPTTPATSSRRALEKLASHHISAGGPAGSSAPRSAPSREAHQVDAPTPSSGAVRSSLPSRRRSGTHVRSDGANLVESRAPSRFAAVCGRASAVGPVRRSATIAMQKVAVRVHHRRHERPAVAGFSRLGIVSHRAPFGFFQSAATTRSSSAFHGEASLLLDEKPAQTRFTALAVLTSASAVVLVGAVRRVSAEAAGPIGRCGLSFSVRTCVWGAGSAIVSADRSLPYAGVRIAADRHKYPLGGAPGGG